MRDMKSQSLKNPPPTPNLQQKKVTLHKTTHLCREYKLKDGQTGVLERQTDILYRKKLSASEGSYLADLKCVP